MLNKFIYAIASFGVICMSSNVYADPCAENGLIEVVGTAKVDAMPDVAVLSFVGKAEDMMASKARDNAEKQISSLINKAKSLGIKKDEISSGSITLYPKYHYDKENGQVFDGYIASRNLEFKIQDFSLIEKLTTSAVESGITSINGFSYQIKDSSKLKEQADEKAIVDAKNKANRLAKGFDVKIKKACSLKFNDSGAPIVYRRHAVTASMMSLNKENETKASEYMPENLTIESSVYASFEIEK